MTCDYSGDVLSDEISFIDQLPIHLETTGYCIYRKRMHTENLITGKKGVNTKLALCYHQYLVILEAFTRSYLPKISIIRKLK